MPSRHCFKSIKTRHPDTHLTTINLKKLNDTIRIKLPEMHVNRCSEPCAAPTTKERPDMATEELAYTAHKYLELCLLVLENMVNNPLQPYKYFENDNTDLPLTQLASRSKKRNSHIRNPKLLQKQNQKLT